MLLHYRLQFLKRSCFIEFKSKKKLRQERSCRQKQREAKSNISPSDDGTVMKSMPGWQLCMSHFHVIHNQKWCCWKESFFHVFLQAELLYLLVNSFRHIKPEISNISVYVKDLMWRNDGGTEIFMMPQSLLQTLWCLCCFVGLLLSSCFL